MASRRLYSLATALRHHETSVLSTNKRSKPGVVFLLGWTGCQEKNLKSYADFYERRGLSVIKFCPSPSTVFAANPKKLLLQAYPYLMEQLYDRKMDKHPLFFHNFSNGGVYMYYAILKRIKEDGLSGLRISGTVFDSAPSPTYWTMTQRAAACTAPGKRLNLVVGSAVAGWMYLWVGLNTIRGMCQRTDIENYRFYVAEELAKFPNLGPQLFLYSKDDAIIPDYGIEWFMEERRKKGVSVSALKWDDSSHVKHMVKYPEQYVFALDRFLASCQKESFGLDEDMRVVSHSDKDILLPSLKC